MKYDVVPCVTDVTPVNSRELRKQERIRKRELRKQERIRKRAEKLSRKIPKTLYISCFISGSYFFVGVMLLFLSYIKTLSFIFDFTGYEMQLTIGSIWDLVKLLLDVEDVVKYTLMRYFVGYPLLFISIVTVILAHYAYKYMAVKMKRSFFYFSVRSIINVMYLVPIVTTVLYFAATFMAIHLPSLPW